ncbi:Gamma-tubulin complex component 2 [Chamberlinius hualienensis]
MSHFHIHRNIVDLLTNLCDSVTGGVAEEYGNKLVERQALHSHVEIGEYALIKKLTENHPSPQELLERYKELKDSSSRNLDLDSVLYLLSKIAADDKLKVFLAKNAQIKQRQGAEGSSSSNAISNDDVAQIRSSIQEETAKRGAESSYKTKLFVKTRNANRSLPELAQWLKRRPYLTLNYVFDDFDIVDVSSILGALPLSSQEHALVGDILHCLGGNSGNYIALQQGESAWSPLKFKLDDSLDPAFRNLVERILPMCSHFSVIMKFIEDSSLFSAGKVKQALAAALWTLIKDYMFLVAQLDHHYRQGVLSLQKLLYFIQPTLRTLEILSSILTVITKENLAAADVLSLLHEKTSLLHSDKKTQQLTLYLTQAACTPYFENLERWIYKGIISDPFHEFLVEDNLVDLKVQPAAYCDGYPF